MLTYERRGSDDLSREGRSQEVRALWAPRLLFWYIGLGKENSPKKGFPDVNRVGDHFGLRLNVKNTLLVSVNCSERRRKIWSIQLRGKAYAIFLWLGSGCFYHDYIFCRSNWYDRSCENIHEYLSSSSFIGNVHCFSPTKSKYHSYFSVLVKPKSCGRTSLAVDLNLFQDMDIMVTRPCIDLSV